jgi:hypothetical protein
VLATVREKLARPENLRYVLRRIEEEVTKLLSDVPETLRIKRLELEAEERRINNLVEFIAEGARKPSAR